MMEPSDSERWRFLADHRLTLHTDGADHRFIGVGNRTIRACPPKFYPVSTGETAEEAIDSAIEKGWERRQARVDHLRSLTRRTISTTRSRRGNRPSIGPIDKTRLDSSKIAPGIEM